jgi:hypothetical protein
MLRSNGEGYREMLKAARPVEAAAAQAVSEGTQGEGRPDAEREEDAVPDFGGPYRAFGHPRSQALPALVLYFNAAERRKYGKKKVQIQYEHLDSDDPAGEGFAADGQSFSFVVCGARKTLRVTVHGRNLEYGYDWLILQRLPWMRSADADRDFRPSDGRAITSIEIEPVEEEEGRGR